MNYKTLPLAMHGTAFIQPQQPQLLALLQVWGDVKCCAHVQ